MSWVCGYCGEINEDPSSWTCVDCGRKKPGNPEMDGGRAQSVAALTDAAQSAPAYEPPEDAELHACGGAIARGLRFHGMEGRPMVAVAKDPEAIVFNDRVFLEVVADVCTSCGELVRRRVKDPEKLRQALAERGD